MDFSIFFTYFNYSKITLIYLLDSCSRLSAIICALIDSFSFAFMPLINEILFWITFFWTNFSIFSIEWDLEEWSLSLLKFELIRVDYCLVFILLERELSKTHNLSIPDLIRLKLLIYSCFMLEFLLWSYSDYIGSSILYF